MTKVLVFESDAAFAQTLVSGLTNYGCTTKVVDDGEAGIQEAEQDRPDLILLSIELPRMNGFSVCNKLKRSGSLKDVPLILLSSEATEETFEQHKRLRTRAEDYVRKPIGVEALAERIRAFVPLSGGSDDDIDFDDVVIEEEPLQADDVDAETEEAFGNLMGPPSMPPAPPLRGSQAPPPVSVAAASAPQLEDLQLDESDGLPIAPEEEAPVSAELPEIDEVEMSPLSSEASDEIVAELAAARENALSLGAELKSARESAQELVHQKEQLERRKEAELGLVQRELDELRNKLSSNQGGTAREFLDLREQLNKKDKEILDVRDQLTTREKEVVKLNDSNIALERERADFSDKVRELETAKTSLEKTRDALGDDKAQANKRAEEFKSKSERLTEELEQKVGELKQAREGHENAMVSRDAEEAALREDHRNQLAAAAAAALEAQKLAVDAAVQSADERAQLAQEATLSAAAGEADRAQLAAIAAREAELKSEQDSKLAALHRANEEGLRKLKAEHQHLTEEAAQAALDRLAARERELLDDKAALLEAQKQSHEQAFAALTAQKAEADADRDANIAALESSLAARTEERDSAQSAVADREGKLAQIEAELSALRADLSQIRAELGSESAKLGAARQKWQADSSAVDKAKEALSAALAELESTATRSIS